jgi:hypothetical protein
MYNQFTRRGFLGVSAASGLLLAGSTWSQGAASQSKRVRPRDKVRICVVFTGEPQPEDRNWGADVKQIEAMKTRLAQAERSLGNVELVSGQSRSPEETAALLEKAGPEAPVLAINVQNFALTRVVSPILEADRPMIMFSLPASGHDWMYAPRWRRAGRRVALLTSSDYDELERALRLLRVIPMMRRTKVLLFPPAQGTKPACTPEEVKKRFGVEVAVLEEKVLDNLIAAGDEAAVSAEIESWTKGAKEIVEPTQEDIEKAARVSVALNQLVEQEQADGLAIGTCMGWLARGFPCLAFARLRDRGVPAACEGDMDSLLTMLLFEYAFDRPGFQGNATFDTARNALWTAHCTAPLKMDGPDGAEAPYLLRGHSEVQGKGCVPEVQYRLGQVVTRTKLVNLKTMLASTGTIVDVPKRAVHGCRSQIVTEVRDAAKMAANWSSALETEHAMTLLHRVVFYGDHMDSLRHLTHLMGLEVLEEG